MGTPRQVARSLRSRGSLTSMPCVAIYLLTCLKHSPDYVAATLYSSLYLSTWHHAHHLAMVLL